MGRGERREKEGEAENKKRRREKAEGVGEKERRGREKEEGKARCNGSSGQRRKIGRE